MWRRRGGREHLLLLLLLVLLLLLLLLVLLLLLLLLLLRMRAPSPSHPPQTPPPLSRAQVERAKVLSNTIKQKRKEKAGKWEVPLPKVRPVAEDEMFKVLRTGKRKKKEWKRMVTKVRARAAREGRAGVARPAPAPPRPTHPHAPLRPPLQVTFVPPGFTRKPPKYERFIRPTGLRMNKAHVTHPELKATFQLEILGVKKNPNGQAYSSLGVITKGAAGCQRGRRPPPQSRGGRPAAQRSRLVRAPPPPLPPLPGSCRHGDRGERQRAGTGDAWRQGGVGQVRTGECGVPCGGAPRALRLPRLHAASAAFDALRPSPSLLRR